MIDHIHLVLKIPPKEAVSDVIGRLKGKSAIRLANEFSKQKN
jgi:putative transposase